MGQQTRTKQITEGDPLSKVYKHLGTPTVEFPLKGKLVQKYRQCTVTSCDGVVLSVAYKATAKSIDEPIGKKPSPSIQHIKAMAEQGDAESQYILAYCLQSGQAIAQDYGKAIGWYTKAAVQGHMPSQHNLGFLYMTGEGVEQDYGEAYMWALMAESNGNDSLVTALIHKLSQKQKLEGELKAEQMQSKLHKKQAD
ncbi:MAG: sel1 repeat family protein [Verrucomicrobia bacterium]|nr:sel1 repeat family protein [Verrucomicrobiota bacterium]